MRWIAVLIFLLVGCAREDVSSSAVGVGMAELTAGMSRQQVTDLIGPAGNRSFKGENEAWQYCSYSNWDGVGRFLTAWFQEGILWQVTTQSRSGSCRFGQIDWGQVPSDLSIEIR